MRTYQQVFQMFKDGKISNRVWERYCMREVWKIFREPRMRDVLIRLKNR
jgi:hypothetical protein